MSLIDDTKKLHETRCELQVEMKAVNDRMSEDEAGGSAEDREKWDTLNTSYDENLAALTTAQDAIKAQAQRADRLSEIEAHNEQFQPPKNIGRDGASLDDGPQNKQAFDQTGEPQSFNDKQLLALGGWMKTGSSSPKVPEATEAERDACKEVGMRLGAKAFDLQLGNTETFNRARNDLRTAQPQAALSGSLGSSGAFTIGETFITNLERAMLAFGTMFQTSEVIRTANGEELRWPTVSDTANTGRQLGESGPVTATSDPTFAQVIWNAYKFTSDEIKVPQELLEDSVFDIASLLSSLLGERLGRIQNTKYTTGTGAATPKGIVTAAAAGITTALSGSILFDEIIDLEHSIDPSRRNLPGVGYMFHDSILQALRKLKDGEGRYLWQAGANSGAPDSLNTRPYTINQDMASSIVTTAVTMLFGQLSMYKIRQVNSIRLYRLVERHRENDQDAFLAFIRGDGNLLDSGDNPVKKMTQL